MSKEFALTERLDSMGQRGEIRVVLSNSGRYTANYKLGTVRWQIPVSGTTAIEAMQAAKRWLKTSIGSRS